MSSENLPNQSDEVTRLSSVPRQKALDVDMMDLGGGGGTHISDEK